MAEVLHRIVRSGVGICRMSAVVTDMAAVRRQIRTRRICQIQVWLLGPAIILSQIIEIIFTLASTGGVRIEFAMRLAANGLIRGVLVVVPRAMIPRAVGGHCEIGASTSAVSTSGERRDELGL